MNMQIVDEAEGPKGSRSETERQEHDHTPTPWRLHKHGVKSMGGGIVYTAGGAHRLVQIEGPDEETVGKLEVLVFSDDDAPGMSRLANNARFIVRAVNNHEPMVEALKGVAIMLNTELERYECEPWAQRVRAALASVDKP